MILFSVLENQDVEGIWSAVRTLNCGTNKRLKPLWMTRKNVAKKKYNLYKRYLLTKQGKDYGNYKLLCNKYNKLIN